MLYKRRIQASTTRMKTLKQHINEALKIGKNLSSFSTYSCQPKTKKELDGMISSRIEKEGPECDLNDIDVSQITDMSWLFYKSNFNGDISKWNTSNVKDMSAMFSRSDFNGDISEWNVSNCKSMQRMFQYSHFNQDISEWNIDKDCDVKEMFYSCPIKNEFKPKALR